MKENQKSLISINENSIFYKIKVFFRNLFKRNIKVNTVQTESIDNNKVEINSNTKESFIENIKNIENEETRLLKLQKQYDNEEIQEKDLTNEQIGELQKLYAKQISDLEVSNENRKNRLLQAKDKMDVSQRESFMEIIKNIEDEETRLLKLQKQYDNEEIQEKDLTDEQVMKLCGLYDRQIENLIKSNEKRKARLREYRRKLQTSN